MNGVLSLMLLLVLLGVVFGVVFIGIIITPYVLAFVAVVGVATFIWMLIRSELEGRSQQNGAAPIYPGPAIKDVAKQMPKGRLFNNRQVKLLYELDEKKRSGIGLLTYEQTAKLCAFDMNKFTDVCSLEVWQIHRLCSLSNLQLSNLKCVDRNAFLKIITMHDNTFNICCSKINGGMQSYANSPKTSSDNDEAQAQSQAIFSHFNLIELRNKHGQHLSESDLKEIIYKEILEKYSPK